MDKIDTIENIVVISQIIESLTEQQSKYQKNSPEWILIERKIIGFECSLFNESVAINLANPETLNEKIPILSILGIHISKYLDDARFASDILLSDESIIILELILNQLETLKQNK